jgi:hypothetical protein
MSTQTPPVAPTRPAFVPPPRRPFEPAARATVSRPPAQRTDDPVEHVGVYGRHPWLIPVSGIACIVAVFVAMVVLTLVAGGITPFND